MCKIQNVTEIQRGKKTKVLVQRKEKPESQVQVPFIHLLMFRAMVSLSIAEIDIFSDPSTHFFGLRFLGLHFSV